jgi:two-component system cell cycle sensor histidine kinase/response regulator CckA
VENNKNDIIRMQSESALINNEERYRMLFTQMTCGCALNEIICDANGKPIDYITLDINPVFEFLLGVQREDVIGKKASEILPHEELAHWLGIFGPVAVTGNSCPYEMYSPFNKKHFEGNVYCPEIGKFAVVFSDVTEKKQADIKLKESENRYRIITDNMRDTLWLMDLNLHTTWISPSVTRTRGFTFEELQEMPMDKQLTPESLNRVMKLYQENMTPDKLLNPEVDVTVSGEFEYYCKDGSIRWSNTVITLLRGTNGEPTGFLCVGRDITERIASEKAFRDSVSQFKELFDSSINAVAIYETEDDGESFVFKDFNKAGEQIEKVRREDVVGKSVMEVFPGVKEFGLFDVFQRVWKTGIPEEYPISFYKDSRIAGWKENYVYKLLSGAIVAIYEDVSERKQAEERLRENEERYRNVIAQAGGVVYQRDWQNQIYTFMDEGIKNLMGYSADEMTPKLFDSLVDDENPNGVYKKFIHSEISQKIDGDTATLYQGEYRIKTKDGQIKYLIDSSIELRNADVGLTHTLGMLQDITQRKFSEQQIRESEIKYRNLFNSLSDAIFITDIEGHFLEVNDIVVERLGYSREELLKMSPIDIDSPDNAELMLERMKKLIETGDGLFDTEHITKDGRKMPVEMNVKIIEYNGTPAILAISRDITERKLSEETLKEALEKYQLIFENAKEGISIYENFPDGSRKLIECNPQYAEMSGYSCEELIQISDTRKIQINHDAPQQETKNQEKAISDQQYIGIFSWIRPDGEDNYIEYTAAQLDINSRRFMIGIDHNITDRRRGERELIENEEKYRALVEGLPDVVMRFDRDARHIYASPSVTKDTGMLPEQFVGKTHRDFGIVSEEVCTYWEQAIARVFGTGEPYEKEFEFDSINGPIVYNWRLVPEINESGNVVSVLSIARDITEHRKSEKSYQDMFNSMSNGISLHEIICDESGKPIDYRFIDVNPAFEKITGLSRESVIGKTALEVLPNLEPYWLDTYGEVALTGVPTSFENYSKELDKYFEITAYSPHKGQFVTIFSDITDRKQTEELQLKFQQTTKLESIGRLASGVAHDFNNMLTVIQGSTSLAMMDLNQSDPLFNRLKMIESASDRATGLTRQLLAFSRKQIIEPKIINLNDIITNLRKMLGRLIGEDIELQAFLDETLTNINADPGQIEQIIINLAVNSRDAMPDGGKLTIETSNVFFDEGYCRMHPNTQVGNYVRMTISDSGHGMSEDTKEHIFEPFWTTKKLGDGTGLGLATVYGIVKQHNGSIECYSELDHGTIFRIYLPQNDEGKAAKLEESKKTDIVTGSDTVLLVEDDNFVREVTTDFLKHLGYNVLVAENGGMAFIIAEQYNETIHLLLTDIVMPGINGRQLAERLLKIHPEMNVLYTSGYTQNIIAHYGVLEEGLNFIGKPYRLQDLANKIREVLNIHN